jgi:hypothetical protein
MKGSYPDGIRQLLYCSLNPGKQTVIKLNHASWVVAVVILILGLSGLPLTAQQREEFQPRNVISANPFGLLLEVFNAEYERVISPTSTIGFGGSTIKHETDVRTHRYVNLDMFWRFYPGESRTRTYKAPVGWAFGAKMGITAVNSATYLGYGFDLNRSFVLGPNDNFYVGLGFGLKRLIGAPHDELGLSLIPTIRLVNVGFVF